MGEKQRILDATEVLLCANLAGPVELLLWDGVAPGRAHNLRVEVESAQQLSLSDVVHSA